MPAPEPTGTHVSITALRVAGPLLRPRFWWHTLRTLRRARAAPGNLSVSARRIGGLHCTVTVWADRAAMLSFLRGRAHRAAMARYPFAGSGRVAGYAALAAPDWADVPAILQSMGRDV
jgi:hypothetical protein